ncbi:RNA-binding protein lark-like [Acipenser ruthenus]|uniref:RNA-binding protein lark-like n=1 Tax=Acipenser ruthenus TaxID=7906 RepID=UPI002740BA48|nr:RNA-binding protein lark-like [Acipenser ruthenus]XP_058868129.1 RNA-binding protein lark-like [Acipenser ruthenus]
MVKIFVGNVNASTTEEELRALFQRHGEVSDCDILKNYGFIHMEKEDEATQAIAALHKHELNGSRITVEYATTKMRNATKVHVGNVAPTATTAKIKELFQRYGKVVECDIVKNYAFVHMQREKEALEAIAELNRTKLEGQKIYVSLSRSHQADDGEEEYGPYDHPYPPPPPPPHHHHHHPHYLPPPHPPADYYHPRGRLPPLPPPPPPRAYYEREAYERSPRYEPYTSRYYAARDPYERRLPPPPPPPPSYYRERSPLGSRRTLLPPPPPPPSSAAAAYSRSREYGGLLSSRYSLGSGFDKDDYLDKYSNGFTRGY